MTNPKSMISVPVPAKDPKTPVLAAHPRSQVYCLPASDWRRHIHSHAALKQHWSCDTAAGTRPPAEENSASPCAELSAPHEQPVSVPILIPTPIHSHFHEGAAKAWVLGATPDMLAQRTEPPTRRSVSLSVAAECARRCSPPAACSRSPRDPGAPLSTSSAAPGTGSSSRKRPVLP